MEEQTLINQVRNLLDHAQDSAFAGDMTRANARLEEIRDLLNLQHADTSETDKAIEEIIKPDDR